MTVLVEGQIQVTLPTNATARKFDGDEHRLSHCMKAVDFIIDLPANVLFVEVKDPDLAHVPEKEKQKYLERLKSGEIDKDLASKYRDSWLSEWSEGQETKPVFYAVLLTIQTLSGPEILTRTEALKKALPTIGPKGTVWSKFVEGCGVFNLESWNKKFPTIPVRRRTEKPDL